MALTRRWAGKAFGTNTGNLFLSLNGGDDALEGTLRLNDDAAGMVVYKVAGQFADQALKLSGEVVDQQEGFTYGILTAVGNFNAKGELNGDWETTIGTGGTFVLFPHPAPEATTSNNKLEQLYTARETYGAIEIDRDAIIKIADDFQRDFPRVVVTITAGTEQARYLEDFKLAAPTGDRASSVKIFASKPDIPGVNQVVSVELGPELNIGFVQGADEAWAIGRLETLKRHIKPLERAYITSFKRWGFGINQVLVLGAIVLLPSLASLRDRAILMAVALIMSTAVNFLHARYVPNSAIYLREKRRNVLQRAWPAVASWIIGIVAAALTAALGAYLSGWIGQTKEGRAIVGESGASGPAPNSSKQ